MIYDLDIQNNIKLDYANSNIVLVNMNIPAYLVDQIRSGRVVLFLGSGASFGAKSEKEPSSPPLGNGLANLLSDKFLGGEGKNKPLSIISEYCLTRTDLRTVQQYIYDIFSPFQPSETHTKVSNFKWAAIITTNYDQILEKAYSNNPHRLQSPVPILKNSDRVDNELRGLASVPLIKLHGCIGMEFDDRCPLILTVDQYVKHRKSRDKLFSRFTEYAGEYTVIFIGYQLEDPDIRAILQELEAPEMSRPRHYVVVPNATDLDKKVWENKRIETIEGTFDDFMSELEAKIPLALRSLDLAPLSHPLAARFNTHTTLTEGTQAFLQNDVMYISNGMKAEPPNSYTFFRGSSYGWASIIAEFDSKRNITDTILSEVVLMDESERPRSTDMYLLKGHAGSGKTVTLKRIAYETATTFDKPTIFIRSDGRLLSDSIEEICRSLGERLYVFIDGIAKRSIEVETFIKSVRSKGLGITIFVTERTNEWNTDCQTLSQLIDDEHELRSLDHNEIDLLLEKLEKNNALGELSKKTHAQRKQAFMEYANRQLLVALYEVTSGIDFADIIFNEFRNIVNDRARNLYLIVCALNRLNVAVRAGLVNRITGISFKEFKGDFFSPLESVVLTEQYKPALDMAYRARHPWIAQIVFERALPGEIERFDLYISLIKALDVGYTADRTAYRELIRAKNILELFPTPHLANELYDAAEFSNDRDGYLFQQRAIYEMKRPNPNFIKSHDLLAKARELLPNDRSIVHSMSELEVARANISKTSIEKNKHLELAKNYSISLTGLNAISSHGYTTLVKLQLEKFKELLMQIDVTDQELAAGAKLVERELSNGLEHFRSDEYLLVAEAEFSKLLNNEQRAFKALDAAYKTNPASPFIAKSLSRLLEEQGNYDTAREVLTKTLQLLPADKGVNAAFARLIDNRFPDEASESEKSWRRSFTVGDTNYTSQLFFARRLYLNGKFDEALKIFQTLKLARVSRDIKTHIDGWITEGNERKLFSGTVTRQEEDFALINIKGQVRQIYLSRSEVSAAAWPSIRMGNSVKCYIGFNYHGAAGSVS